MKEQDVARLAVLLNKKPEDVNTALEDGGISEMIDELESGRVTYTTDDFETFKSNFKTELETEWASTGKIPKGIYDRAKGLALEVREKEIAREHGIDSWSGLDDLVAKISNKQAKNPEDVTKLKDQIDKLTADYESKILDLSTQNDQRFIESKINELVNNVPIDAKDKVLANQRKILKTMINSEIKFKVDSDNIVIEGAPVSFKQNNLDPRPLQDVVNDFAKDYVSLSSGSGGRGDKSSTSTQTSVDFEKYCKDNGIRPNTPEHFAALKKFKDDGVEII